MNAAANPSSIFAQHQPVSVDLDGYCDVASAASITESVDLGGTSVKIGMHPILGKVALVNTSGANHAVIRL